MCAATWDDVDGWWIHDAKLIDFPLRVIEFQISISERDTTTTPAAARQQRRRRVTNDKWITIFQTVDVQHIFLVRPEMRKSFSNQSLLFPFIHDAGSRNKDQTNELILILMYTAVIILFVFICFVIVAHVIIGDNWINGLLCRRRK